LDHQLKPLRHARWPFAAFLDEAKRIETDRAVCEPRGKNVGSSNGILHREVYADPAYGRHRMRRIADAEKTRHAPAFQPVDLDSKQLDIVPRVDFGRSIRRETEKARNSLAKGVEPCRSYRVDTPFGYHEGALPIAAPVQHHNNAARLELPHCFLGIADLTG
jgi:hypothetical protein